MVLSLKACKIPPKKIEILNQMSLYDAEDLLSYYPFRYEQLELKEYDHWQIKDKVVFEARVITYPKSIRFKGSRTMTKFQVENEDDVFDITLFNRPWINKMELGQVITIIGKYEGNRKVTAIQYNFRPLNEQLGIQPVYPLKYGLTQKNMQDVLRRCFDNSKATIENDVPSKYRERYRLLDKKDAYEKIHFPENATDVSLAIRTLKYEEFLKFHLAIQLIRKQNEKVEHKQGKNFNFDDVFVLANHLPFPLTKDQVKAVNDVLEDLQSDHVMYRLIQGDVGCGKTVVAALGMVACSYSKKQAALLAPTEILAKQHYLSLKDLLRSTDLKIEVLYSALPTIKKKEILENLKEGKIDILVGTHSLIQADVVFKDLGFVVADEQHRFGVEQRRKLLDKGDKVDFLLMSATPIPRTLANTLYGDMDVTTIETMPSGRKEVKTVLIEENSFRSVLSDVKEILQEGRQIYVVCSAIEESENFSARNVVDIYENLQKQFKGIATVGILHGKMSSDEKEQVMQDFKKNKIQILVSTTVIEVGINVVNATCMIIYDAHRFGLSQLHQLRGRVQRGSHQGICYLLTDSKEQESLERLNVLVKSNNGFEISFEDLRLRGPGDILGTRQSGLPAFLLGNLVEDTKIIETTRKDVQEILDESTNIENERLIKKVLLINENALSTMD
ncbi:ATP-dependent DNA helicase RecG [Anaerorhabdus furcosa]|uniref:ATP-dependent DNA helicase RecG n=1 Tax=Anaerorhabdus furcosa TaxID=118967 RepID=A0A1T4Q344_9FIRM|nr:ATP-dependent DNA helicase RecG [Anaerorhabdus furcosa]SJZ98222.1 ATP-dependent DNA helicase RecG [Anaerorhabdus furcosa]